MSRHTEHDQSRTCGPNCPYRGLYEGSQRSLTDLASRQADALGRIGRLRNQIVLGLKRILPVEFNEAERALGRRLSEVDDELLGAYLESFLLLASGRNTAEASAFARVRSALSTLGIDVRGAKSLADLAVAIEHHASLTTGVRTGLGGLFADQAPGAPRVLGAPGNPAPSTEVVPQAPTPPAPVEVPTPPTTPPRRPVEVLREEAPVTPPGGANDVQNAGNLGDLFEDDEPVDLIGVEYPGDPGFPDDVPAPTPSRAPRPARAQSSPAKEQTAAARPAEATEVITPATTTPAPTATRSTEADLNDLFGEVAGPKDPKVAQVLPTMTANEPTTSAPVDQGQGASPSAKVEPAPTPSAPTGIPATGGEVTTRAVAKAGGIRPALLPQPPKTRQRRTKNTVRTSVIPGEAALDVPVPAGPDVEIDETMANRLLAVVSIPRPVYTADLVDLVKSPDAVSEWLTQALDSREVRVVNPKSKHKLRGSLIYPNDVFVNASAEIKRSTWVRCLTRYTGTKIYELGVLLHRFGDDVIGDELGHHTVLLRLALPQGLVGLLVVLDPTLGEGEPTREALVKGLETLMHERLVQVAVLTTNAEIVNVLTEVIAEEAASRGWAPTMPVTLAKSWEYANGTGVGLAVLGA